MTNKHFEGNLTPEEFMQYVLRIESENLKNIDKQEKKVMVSQIIREYEEAKKNGNK